ncbi:MAG TPA: RIP metalloprotease RseP, partial [Pseudogulbenkiania sp.]|nr:RIP metalloprotease RseP [Pseudogulbenkiania sp.]
MISILAFLLAIGVLVTFHELGHYVAARCCGVKVLRFSIGFGKPLFTVKRGETEWAICPIPLGGYVKMLDEREGVVAPADWPRAFNRQPVGKRMLIVVAGPVMNLLLAALFYWVVIGNGLTLYRPLVGTVVPESPAAIAGFQPGDRVLAIAGVPVTHWNDISLALLDRRTDAGEPLTVRVETGAGKQLDRVVKALPETNGNGQIGILPVRYSLTLGVVEQGGAAERAGLRAGDTLLSANGRDLHGWAEWVGMVHNSPGKEISIAFRRAGESRQLTLRPDSSDSPTGFVGRIGAAPTADASWLAALRYEVHPTVAEAGWMAVQKTWSNGVLSLRMFGRMLIGQASWSNLSGPITIASVAGQTARQGLDAYLEFLALISVSIGILNLLPIPILDGGHLMYYTAELIKGSPVSE